MHTETASLIARALNRAADMISCTGAWTRGVDKVSDDKSSCGTKWCARGAVVDAINEIHDEAGGAAALSTWHLIEELLNREISRSYPGRYYGVTGFNDTQKDKRKVIRLLRRTARRTVAAAA